MQPGFHSREVIGPLSAFLRLEGRHRAFGAGDHHWARSCTGAVSAGLERKNGGAVWVEPSLCAIELA
eukprot:COSAG02_NODE_17955_length_969_cov_0.854023_1_plen_66_part_10